MLLSLLRPLLVILRLGLIPLLFAPAGTASAQKATPIAVKVELRLEVLESVWDVPTKQDVEKHVATTIASFLSSQFQPWIFTPNAQTAHTLIFSLVEEPKGVYVKRLVLRVPKLPGDPDTDFSQTEVWCSLGQNGADAQCPRPRRPAPWFAKRLYADIFKALVTSDLQRELESRVPIAQKAHVQRDDEAKQIRAVLPLVYGDYSGLQKPHLAFELNFWRNTPKGDGKQDELILTGNASNKQQRYPDQNFEALAIHLTRYSDGSESGTLPFRLFSRLDSLRDGRNVFILRKDSERAKWLLSDPREKR